VAQNTLNKAKMIVKIHKNSNGQLVLAVCDKDLLGKKFEEGNKQLDLTSDFYKGQEKNEKEVADLMRNAYMVNVVGEKSIKIVLKENLITRENISLIAKIPYSNFVV
jgi:hypothetical protein